LLKQSKLFFADIDSACIPFINEMHKNGILIDKEHFKKIEIQLLNKLSKIQIKIDKYCGHHINPASSDQVVAKLNEYNLTSVNSETDQITSADHDTLSGIDSNEFVELVIKYKQIDKLLSTYITKYPALIDENNFLHTEYSQARVETGRLSSARPNLQNIPSGKTEEGKLIRYGFIAEPGFDLLQRDYSAQEIYWTAILSGDPTMLNVLLSGGDIHDNTEMKIFGTCKKHRKPSKMINFGVMYGISKYALHRKFITEGVTQFSQNDCQTFIDEFYNAYPLIRTYIRMIEQFIKRYGYIQNYYGHRRRIPEIKLKSKRSHASALRKAVNYTIQSTSAFQMKLAMSALYDLINSDCLYDILKPRMQVHDELILSCRSSEIEHCNQILVNAFKNACTDFELKFKSEGKAGKRWGTLKTLGD